MSFQKRTLARSLLGLGAVIGVAMAAEPIFVTPPDKDRPPASRQAQDPLDDLPLAKTYPEEREAEPADPPKPALNPQALPVFVAPTAAPTAEKAAPVVPEAGPTVADSPEPAPQPPRASDVRPPAPEVGAAEPSPAAGADGGEKAEETGEAPATDIRFGLDLKPIKVQTGLPPEVGILQTALAKTVDRTELLPEADALKALCSDAGKIADLAAELAATPLIEVTTHFTLWREAMARLQRSVDGYRQSCGKPSPAAVSAFRRVIRDFDSLLETR